MANYMAIFDVENQRVGFAKSTAEQWQKNFLPSLRCSVYYLFIILLLGRRIVMCLVKVIQTTQTTVWHSRSLQCLRMIVVGRRIPAQPFQFISMDWLQYLTTKLCLFIC